MGLSSYIYRVIKFLRNKAERSSLKNWYKWLQQVGLQVPPCDA
jgi:hypothetical protein